MKDAQNLLTHIAEQFLAELDEQAVSGKLTVRMIEGHAEIEASSYNERGRENSFATKTRFYPLFEELRMAMYETSPERGAWYIAVLSLDTKGKFSYDFNYDDRSKFNIQPSEEEFEDDLRLFPRVGKTPSNPGAK